MAVEATPPPPRPRVMMLPCPLQGHVKPLMELAHRLVEHGIEVDFVNTDINHDRIVKAMEAGGEAGAAGPAGINMVSLPDGMGPDGDRSDIGKLAGGLPAAMLGRIEEMVVSNKIRWVVADVSMSWVLDLVAKLGLRVALFSTFAAAVLVLRLRVPKMIEDGIFDEFGNVTRKERIQLSPKMPAVDATKLPWTSLRKSPESQRMLIQMVIKTNPEIALAETIVCNTFDEIESEALALLPKPALAVGPLEMLASTTSAACHFWPEDRTCLTWLDAQAPSSVVYVAFGSVTVFDATQVKELADGLLLTGRPFLWVVRPNFANGVDEGWLDEFKRRVGNTGLVVSWAPQQRVLSHPSLACFVTHCGWNSTIEGVRNGVPFLCWPYYADQFCNQSYICDVWGTGLRICAIERDVVTKEEIRDKVAGLLRDEGIKARVLSLKQAACASVTDGGSSHRDLLKLVNLLREQ
ncbi:hypothetical protein EJB05_04422 [Eragrostis curvula]|uniref:Glycosyltransferase n=1 Tax=Eragrostis curvula TaxID=38414 RepID=A0A5J9W9X2_9POAL|nr:hypothetical protein EJB05_04422 [Eragrostis curvula]